MLSRAVRSGPGACVDSNQYAINAGCASRRRGTHECPGREGLRDHRVGTTNNRLSISSRESALNRSYSSPHPSHQAQNRDQTQTCLDDAGGFGDRSRSEGKIRVGLELKIRPIQPVNRADTGGDVRGAPPGRPVKSAEGLAWSKGVTSDELKRIWLIGVSKNAVLR